MADLKSIFESDSYKQLNIIELGEGTNIFMRALPLVKQQEILQEFDKLITKSSAMVTTFQDLADEDITEEKLAEVKVVMAAPYDYIFNELVVGDDGTKFDEFEDKSVVDLFPPTFINDTILNIAKAVNPSPK